jgi:hypothetical protein
MHHTARHETPFLLVVTASQDRWPGWALSDLEHEWETMAVAAQPGQGPLELGQRVMERLASGAARGWQLRRAVFVMSVTIPQTRAELFAPRALVRQLVVSGGGELWLDADGLVDDSRQRELELFVAGLCDEVPRRTPVSVAVHRPAPRSGVFARPAWVRRGFPLKVAAGA